MTLPFDRTVLTEDLLQRAAQELTARLRAGASCRVEQFRDRHPELWNSSDAVLELILTEFDVRCRLGHVPSCAEYYERFPQLRERLERVFAIHEFVGDADSDEVTLRNLDEEGAPPAHERPDMSVAGFDILDEIGRGGMGVVYRARQRTLNRIVALKLIHAGPLASAEQRERFRQEAEIVARLKHPNIVQVYEFGERDGILYLAMEYVPGASLERHLADLHAQGHGGWSPAQSAQLTADLARTVHAAHLQGVIHRDLKPANVLIHSNVQAPDFHLTAIHCASEIRHLELKVADFGLARVLESDTLKTATGAVLGTPSYMAPEQAGGRRSDITPATDVFSLGVILYEMLTGRLPFRGSTFVDTLEQVRHCDPVPPRRLLPGLPRDLETICLKCLNKDSVRRYASAEALAQDLERYLAGRPILARPTSLVERGVKWMRRRPVVAALLAVIAFGTLASVGIIAWHLRITLDALRDRDKALAGEQAQRATAEATLARQSIVLARAYWTDFRIREARRALDQCPEAHRHDEWQMLHRSLNANVTHIRNRSIYRLAWTPNSRCLIGIDKNHVCQWDASTGEELTQIRHDGVSRVFQTSVSADGRKVHIYGMEHLSPDSIKNTRGQLPKLFTCDLVSRTVANHTFPIDTAEIWRSPYRIGFDPEFVVFAYGAGYKATNRDRLKLIAVDSRREILTFPESTGACYSLFFNQDGTLLTQLHPGEQADRSAICIWDTSRGKLVKRIEGRGDRNVSGGKASDDGRRIVYLSARSTPNPPDRKLHVWDRVSDREILVVDLGSDPVTYAALSPDGSQVAWGGAANHQVFVADVQSGRIILILREAELNAEQLTFSPDGRRLAAGGVQGVYIYDLTFP